MKRLHLVIYHKLLVQNQMTLLSILYQRGVAHSPTLHCDDQSMIQSNAVYLNPKTLPSYP